VQGWTAHAETATSPEQLAWKRVIESAFYLWLIGGTLHHRGRIDEYFQQATRHGHGG